MAVRAVGEFCEFYADAFYESSPRRRRKFGRSASTQEVEPEAGDTSAQRR